MLRRKNNEIPYVQTHTNNQSPYRFERKNPNLSPGLSPMRCRTPTRGNISPFRGVAPINDNYRGHSPIKFVSSKVTTNPSTKGFFRTQSHPNQHPQKYATSTANNDHSIRRESYYENPTNSKINFPYENSERTMHHENTKLFSKLVEKLNSEKKKEPELVKRNTKPEMFRPHENANNMQSPDYYKPTGAQQKLTRQKSQTENPTKIEPIVQHIKPVQSVVYEQTKTTYAYQQQTLYNPNGKENKELYHHEQTYKFKAQKEEKQQQATQQQFQAVPLEMVKNKNVKTIEKVEEKTQQYTKTISQQQQKVDKLQTTPTKHDSAQKQKQRQRLRSDKKQPIPHQQHPPSYQKYPLPDPTYPKPQQTKKITQSQCFDDIEMFLGKVRDSPWSGGYNNKDESFSNNSEANNVNMSFMNMDPFV